ncbi:MAG: class F sortase [Candidatus Limnocylindrales bacterium]
MTRPEPGPGQRGALVVTLLALTLAGCDLLPRVGLAPTFAPTPAPTFAPTPAPSSTPERVALDEPSPPVRIRIPSLGIDLPVIRSDRRVRGSTPGYPACDVAIWWEVFDRPGQPGTTWIMAHAQEGMFLPLLEAANERSPRSLRGRLVELQLRDGRLLTYRTFRVKPRTSTTDLRLATAGRREREHRLVLQTSTGRGSDPKLLVAARLVRATSTDEPRPRPKPRACG